MTNDEFRKSYFDQYADEGDVLDEAWFQAYFADAEDWMDVELKGEGESTDLGSGDDSYTVYSDQNSAMGGYWGTTTSGIIEGPFETVREVVSVLGFEPDPFAAETGEEDFDNEVGSIIDEDENENGDGDEDVDEDEDEDEDEDFDDAIDDDEE